jgi:hypothetical protein
MLLGKMRSDMRREILSNSLGRDGNVLWVVWGETEEGGK